MLWFLAFCFLLVPCTLETQICLCHAQIFLALFWLKLYGDLWFNVNKLIEVGLSIFNSLYVQGSRRSHYRNFWLMFAQVEDFRVSRGPPTVPLMPNLHNTLQMFTGVYSVFTGKSECGDFKFMGIACYSQSL